MHRTLRARRALAALLLVPALLTACGNGDTTAPTDPTPPAGDGVIVRFATPAGDFLVVIEDEESLARLEGAEPGEHIGIPNGRLVKGDGGVNTGHDWHLVEVEIVDMTIEVCDGTADYVDDLGYDAFVEQHGDRFCPWGATFEEIVS
jgi:hypothetical protein